MSTSKSTKSTLYIFVLFSSLIKGHVHGTCKYVKETQRDEGTMEVLFERTLKEEETAVDTTRRYNVVGIKFNDTVLNFKVRGDRFAVKSNDKLWFVNDKQPEVMKLIKFNIEVRTEKPTTIDALSFNGKTVCFTREKELITLSYEVSGDTSLENSTEKILTLSLSFHAYVVILLPSLILGIFMVLILIYVKNFKKMACRKWIQTYSLVLSIDRGISAINPNRKNALPSNSLNYLSPDNNATYLDLAYYDYTTREALQIDPQVYKSLRLKPCDANDNKREENIKEEPQDNKEILDKIVEYFL